MEIWNPGNNVHTLKHTGITYQILLHKLGQAQNVFFQNSNMLKFRAVVAISGESFQIC